MTGVFVLIILKKEPQINGKTTEFFGKSLYGLTEKYVNKKKGRSTWPLPEIVFIVRP